jgi:L-aminopeptidase/D-esterase-like protein
VRQTETAALRKATKSSSKGGGRALYGSNGSGSGGSAPASKGGSGSSSVTFSRAVAGIFSPGAADDVSLLVTLGYQAQIAHSRTKC